MPPVKKALVRSCLLDAESATKFNALTGDLYQGHNCWYFDFL